MESSLTYFWYEANLRAMNKLIIAFLLISSIAVCGQDNTFQKHRNVPTDQEVYGEGEPDYSKVLIIPFEPKMYISGVDKQISQRTGLSYYEIRDNMRYAISDHMLHSVGGGLKATSLIHVDTGAVGDDLAYIYNSIGYKYKLLPQEDIEKAAKAEEDAKMSNKIKGSFNKLIKKEVKPEEKEEAGSSIQNGQIKTVRNNYEKFMNTSIHNPNLLKVLSAKYESDLFLFINELDIEEEASGQRVGLSSLSYKRKVKVHYTIFEASGKEVHGGAAIAYLPASTNDMNKIINGSFPKLTENMSQGLPAAYKSPEQKELEKEQQKKADEQRKEIEKL